ncbi:HEAT repeat-containing protein 1 [Lobosporangium transversale]|nr:HEAT repeat-containing protein 1 [Lobosporangium transversale]
MSSLAQQLKRIGTTDANKGSEKSAKHRASFLFDSKQAADYDIDTIFSIGANGIAELKQLDPKFAPFEQTLFGESMKSVDRVLQTKEDNAKLDESISLFLRQLSPYFLLKPAGKALEWLIRRFRINEFNVDAIMRTILPYHETALFVTMVSILHIEESSRWVFLRPIRKSKQPLGRTLLIQYMLKDRSLVEFVCETVLQAVTRRTSFKTLISFYAAVMLQYIASVPIITDEVLTAVFPYILDGLKSKASGEYQIASYMIISQISERATLTYEVLSSLFNSMTSTHTNSYQMVLCLVHICQTQETFDMFPEVAFKHLSKIEGIDTIILSVIQKYNAQRFLYSFLAALARHSLKDPNNARILTTILKETQQPSIIVSKVCSAVLDLFLSEHGQQQKQLEQSEQRKAQEAATHSILQVLHQNYAADLDTALHTRLEESKEDERSAKTHSQLYTFISKAFSGTRHQPLKESNTTLFLSVNHAEASIRFLAVKKLDEILKEKSSELANVNNEDTFVKDTLLARLQDDDERIVQQVLSMEGLKTFVAPQDLLQGLINVIAAPSTTRGTRRHCLVYLLTVFLANNTDLQDQVLLIILGHMMFTKDFHKASVAVISNISISALKNEPLLKNVSSAIKDFANKEDGKVTPESMVTANLALIGTLATNLTSHRNLSEGLNIYLQGLQSSNIAFRLFSIFIITKAIHKLNSAEQQIKVVSLYLPILLVALKAISPGTKALKAEVHDGLPSTTLLNLIVTKSLLPSTELSVIRFSLLSIVSDLKKPTKTNVSWLSTQEPLSDYARVVLSLYSTFISPVRMSPYEKMIEKLFELHLTSDSIEFLCRLWTDSSVPSLVQLRSLQIASANLQAFVKQATTTDGIDFQVTIPTILIALANPMKAMREVAVTCLNSITSLYAKVKITGKKSKGMAADIYKFDSFYGKTSNQLEFLMPDQVVAFTSELLKSREEFITDGGYLSKFLGEALNHESSEAKAASSLKNSVLSFLLSHVLAFTRTSSRVELLHLLDPVRSSNKLKMLLPLIESLVHSTFVGQNKTSSPSSDNTSSNSNDSADDIDTELARCLIRCFSSETSSLLEGKSAKYRNVFLQLLKLDNTAATNTDTEESSSSIRRLTLNQLNSEFFAGFNLALQRDIFVVLIDLATNAPQDTVRIVKQVLREIPIHSELIIYELALIQTTLMQETMVNEEGSSKRQRKAGPEDPMTPSATVESLYRLVTVLELLEYKEVAESNKLVTPLFELLSTIMNSDLNNNTTPVSIEYIDQLMLSSLTSFIRQATEPSGDKTIKLDESILRVDLVVNCIRATGNPQTHHQALLLMAAIASLYPEKVLHNIMPVFTFMGANVLRQDDNYSFHVIQQTLEKIIPPLVAAHRHQSSSTTGSESQNLIMQVRPIIKVFVDAMFHIPKHRRLRLFSVLISTLGEDEFLYAVICMIIGKHTERASKGHQTEADSLSDFALALSNQFSAVVQMKSVSTLLDMLQALPNEKDVSPEESNGDVDMDKEEYLFDVNSHSNKQIRQFKLSVLLFASNVMTSKSFLSKILAQTNTDSSAETVLEKHYLQLAERLLTLVGTFSHFVNVLVARKEPSAVSIKFWRGIVKVTYDVLDKVHILLSLPSFINIMVALFEHRDVTIRRKAMGLFNQKISNASGSTTSAVPAMYQDMVVSVSENLRKAVEEDRIEGASAEEVAINKQTALLCLSTIVRQFGASHPVEISKIIPTIIGPSGLQHPNEQVKASCLVCLTFMCQELGIRVVPFLPKFMPVVLSILSGTLISTNATAAAAAAAESDSKKSSRYTNSVLLQLAVVSHLEALIKTLPQFVSPYVTKILESTLHPVLTGYVGNDASKLQILDKNKQLLGEMAVHIQPRILLPPVLGYYETAIKDGKDSLLALFELVGLTIQAMPRDVIAVHYKQIFKFFLGAFDFRRSTISTKEKTANDTTTNRTITVVEDAVLEAFMKLVMKLNETLFKPLFLKTLDWATTELQIAKASFQDVQARQILFYKLLNALLEQLKSIVTPYYGYVVDNVIEALAGYVKKAKEIASLSLSYEETTTLDAGKDEIKSRDMDELWPWMISSLQKCFLYDNDGLWNADRFEKLLHPLVDQLLVTTQARAEDSEEQDGMDVWRSYVNRMDTWLVPCLGQLAVTLSNDALWKPLNYQVLLKTREENKLIRLSALKVLQEFYKRLGEEFLILLPETIPFLAELMEDDDHEVEALTQQVIADIEVYLGGSLQKYFH